MCTTKNLSFVQLDTSLFSYEPILRRLQELKAIPLVNELLFWKLGTALQEPPAMDHVEVVSIVTSLTQDPRTDLQHLLKMPKQALLDESQAKCVVASLKQRISLIQGPPGEMALRSPVLR